MAPGFHIIFFVRRQTTIVFDFPTSDKDINIESYDFYSSAIDIIMKHRTDSNSEKGRGLGNHLEIFVQLQHKINIFLNTGRRKGGSNHCLSYQKNNLDVNCWFSQPETDRQTDRQRDSDIALNFCIRGCIISFYKFIVKTLYNATHFL